jgi:hypothetical protein
MIQNLREPQGDTSVSGASRRKERVTAVLLFGTSLLYLFGTLRLKIGTGSNPGAGFVPLGIGSLLLLCTTIYMMRVLSVKHSDNGRMETGAKTSINFRVTIGILACMTGYALVLESLKYIVSTVALTFFMLVLLKPQRPILSFVTALVIAVASFVVISVLFEVALPFGFFEHLLFRIVRRISA